MNSKQGWFLKLHKQQARMCDVKKEVHYCKSCRAGVGEGQNVLYCFAKDSTKCSVFLFGMIWEELFFGALFLNEVECVLLFCGTELFLNPRSAVDQFPVSELTCLLAKGVRILSHLDCLAKCSLVRLVKIRTF